MKTPKYQWTTARIYREIGAAKILFSHPIQREDNMWDKRQKSLFIQSVAEGYPVPAIYVVAESDKSNPPFQVLDGKQRLTSLFSYLEDGFRLILDHPFVINGKEYEANGKLYSQLPKHIKDYIAEYAFDITEVKDASNKEIAEVFYRLNNSTPLSTQQKVRAKVDNHTIERFKQIMKHPLVKQNAYFNKSQLKRSEDEVAILQGVMLIDETHEVKGFGHHEVANYMQKLKDKPEKTFKDVLEAMDYLNEVVGLQRDKITLKKSNIPFVMYIASSAIYNGITVDEFIYWYTHFKDELSKPDNKEWAYKAASFRGGMNRSRINQRLAAITDDFAEFCLDIKAERIEQERIQNSEQLVK